MKDYFRTSEAAKFLNVTAATVVNWINAGMLIAYATAGGHFRIMRKDLINFIREKGRPIPDEIKSSEERYRILIVDDEKNVAESVKVMLEDIGIGLEIETAYDGFEAGIKAVRLLPHLIILDAIMPGADGDRICILVREDEALKNTKILVFTGYPDKGKRLLELGADKLIVKGTKEADVDNIQKEVISLLGIKYHKVIKPTYETKI